MRNVKKYIAIGITKISLSLQIIPHFMTQKLELLKKNILSIILALIIMYLSLASSDTFKEVSFINIPNLDKIIHIILYFSLMTTIIFENRQIIKSLKHLLWISIIPLAYGILMEVLQATITVSRFASIWDILFNASGILVSLLLWIWSKPFIKKSFR
jgi:VanZ family protein